MIYFGNKKITDLNYGGTPIKEAYYGSTLVWRKQALEGVHNLHSWVDLGLPSGLLWATMNVGANNTNAYGDYYSWGEITPKSSYNANNSPNYNISISDFSGQAGFDVATANWGGGWRMPTKEECQELDRYCSTEIVDVNMGTGFEQIIVKSCLVKGVNNKSIYMPLGGYKYNEQLMEASTIVVGGGVGHYWSSTPSNQDSEDLKYAHDLNVKTGPASSPTDSNYLYVPRSARYYGHTIRPVLDRSSLNQ